MKIRKGFVSNSSSSSFVINLENLTASQLQKILDLPNSQSLNHLWSAEPWVLEVKEEKLTGYTFLDNFDMHVYLAEIGVNLDKVKWE